MGIQYSPSNRIIQVFEDGDLVFLYKFFLNQSRVPSFLLSQCLPN